MKKMKHIEKNKEHSWHTLEQIMKIMKNIEAHNEQYWNTMKTNEQHWTKTMNTTNNIEKNNEK